MNLTSASPSEWLVAAAKKNPEGLLLLAAGACLLLRSSGNSSSPQNRKHKTQQAESLGRRDDGAAEFVGDMSGRAKETVESLASSATDYASRASRTVTEQSTKVAKKAQTTFQNTIDRILQEQPLAIAAAGIAAGAAVAAAFPASELERQHLGPYGEQMSQAADRVRDQLKDATAKAGETLKAAANERGISAEGLKEVASEVAGAFGNSMKATGSSGEKPEAQAAAKGTGARHDG